MKSASIVLIGALSSLRSVYDFEETKPTVILCDF